VQPRPAEDAGSVGPGERCNDNVANPNLADFDAHSLDAAYELVPRAAASLTSFVVPGMGRPAGDASEKSVGRMWF